MHALTKILKWTDFLKVFKVEHLPLPYFPMLAFLYIFLSLGSPTDKTQLLKSLLIISSIKVQTETHLKIEIDRRAI